jgi:hypothetical protein
MVSAAAPDEPRSADQPATWNLFDSNVRVTISEETLIVESDGIPTHPTATFPNATNPNRIQKQAYRFLIPRRPKKAESPTPTPFGPIGVAVNGIPFYNPYNAQGRDAVLGPSAEVFDSCCGHPDPLGRYHYHKYPVCIKSPFEDPKDKHSPLLGLMFDGFALYGPNGQNGKPPTDLDDCNGHEDAARGYHYHVTEKFPYLIGAYRGTPDPSSIDRPRFPGRNGPFAMGTPPPNPMVTALDTDRDGMISAAELERAPRALLVLDSDRDGRLSREETRPVRPNGPPPPPPGGPSGPPAGDGPPPPRPGGPPPNPLFLAVDSDRDGTLAADEIARSTALLKTLDRNRDGTLSPDELRPPPPDGFPPPRDGPPPAAAGPPACNPGPPPEPPEFRDPVQAD